MAASCATQQIILRPNCSLSSRGALKVFLFIVAGAFGIAAPCLATGAWPILPFLVLEIAAIGMILRCVSRRSRDYEAIVLDRDRLEVAQHRGGRETRHAFQRYWARVALVRDDAGWYPSRLFIRSHGRSLEVGTTLDEEAREALARKLKQAVGPDYRDPVFN